MTAYSAAYIEILKEYMGPLVTDYTIQKSAEQGETTEEIVIDTLLIFMQTNE